MLHAISAACHHSGLHSQAWILARIGAGVGELLDCSGGR